MSDRPPNKRIRRAFVRRLIGLRQYDPRPLRIPRRYARQAPPDRHVSIALVTPSFNQARFISATIDSVLSQRYPHLQYAVHDGGSSDGTSAVVQKYASELSFVCETDGGQADAVNRAFRRTRGDVMAWLNSDDFLLPGALAYVADYFAGHPDVDVVYGHRVVVDERGDEIGRWVLPRHDSRILAWADFVPQETMFWRRTMWEQVGGALDDSFQFAMDWDLILRFEAFGARIVRVPRFLSAFRVHDEQKTSAQLDLGFEEMDRLRERVNGRPVTSDDFRGAIRKYLLARLIYRTLYRMRLLRT